MADVCLILEGTYPYVPGGVSSCILQMIKGTPQINYGIVFIGAKKDEMKEYHHEIPNNIDYIKEIYLYDYDDSTDDINYFKSSINAGSKKSIKFNKTIFENFQEALSKGISFDFSLFYNYYFSSPKKEYLIKEELFGIDTWNFLSEQYKSTFSDSDEFPFLDFIYNWKYINLPLFKLMNFSIPKAKTYHCLSTGYAGFLGTLAKIKTKNPLLITEHGIYSHEREIEMLKSDWLFDSGDSFKITNNLPYFKEQWINMFHCLSRSAYMEADAITTLYQGNIDKQIKFGAPREKLEIIPNGINSRKLNHIQRNKKNNVFTIGLIGRVVPIKDIKTFIKTISIIKSKIDNIEVLIMGPFDEDPDYYIECKRMISLLQLESVIKFTGNVNLIDYYPTLDIMVLTSISEGQPIVILEAFAFGIPCVTTDVGSCKDLIFGMTDEDKSIGVSGDIAPFGRPKIISDKIISILNSPKKMEKMSKAAKKRIETFYTEDHYLNNYLNLYSRFSSNGSTNSWQA